MTATDTQPDLADAIAANSQRYAIDAWGAPYFSISAAGALAVTAGQEGAQPVELIAIVEALRAQGLETPVLLRFREIVRDRLAHLDRSFRRAIASEGYQGGFRFVFPIKVNQQGLVIEEVRDEGASFGFGLEAGSKPELVAVLGMTAHKPQTPIVCNGFKDSDYIEAAMLAARMGRNIIPIVERYKELHYLIEQAERWKVRPTIGLRAKLAARGIGQWEDSGGMRSKFGLFTSELIDAVELLRAHNLLDRLNLLHFHIGSQMSDIRVVKDAVTELSHVYTELRRLGADITMLDIGGGLAVDYDGSRSSDISSKNYSVDEYATDVVYRIKAICDEAGAPHPMILCESGRAIISHASIFVFNAEAAAHYGEAPPPTTLEEITQDPDADPVPQPILDLLDAHRYLSDDNLTATYHDITHAREQVMTLFALGQMSLPVRAAGERLFWAIGRRILERARSLEELPSDLEELPRTLADQYFCNLSVFQSLPDAWAVDQLFPICPIHRLDEPPTRQAIISDLTCDSDGKLDAFPHPDGVRSTIELHELRSGEPYYIAAFLVGAYQEILGDYHNLFGDTNGAHISISPDGSFEIEHAIKGETVADVLDYVEISPKRIADALRGETGRAVAQGILSDEEGRTARFFFDRLMNDLTYLLP